MSKCPGCGYEYPEGCDATCEYRHPISEWISVKDRMPEGEGYYLIVCDDRRCLAEYSNKDWYTITFIDEFKRKEEIVFASFDNLVEWTQESTTHWMPLPKSPEADIRVEWGGALRCVKSDGRNVNEAEELNRMEALKNNE